MKTAVIHGLGWILISVVLVLILIHGYNAFINDNPPYNINKGHIEVGVIGLFFWFVAQKCIRFNHSKVKQRK